MLACAADIEQLAKEGRWLDAPQVLRRYDFLVQRGIKALSAWRDERWPLSDTLVEIVQAAVLACLQGYSVPPLRPSCVITLQRAGAMDRTKGMCGHKDCVNRGCKGNRLLVQRSPSGQLLPIDSAKQASSHALAAHRSVMPVLLCLRAAYCGLFVRRVNIIVLA